MADAPSPASKGMPLSKAAMELGRKGRHFHPSATYRWAAKRGPLTDMHAKKFLPGAGFKRHCGQIRHNVLGRKACLFTMDHSIRFVPASMASPKRLGAKPPPMFGRAARPAGSAPRVFAADGLNAFVAPARKAFRHSVGLFVHIAGIHAQNACNVQEGLDGETKPLPRRRGGFKTTD